MDNKNNELETFLTEFDFNLIRKKLEVFDTKLLEVKKQIKILQDRMVEINEEKNDVKIKFFDLLYDKSEDCYQPPF